MSFKSAYIAIIGLPNAGKSTLLNALVEKDLSIISDRPQTTRNQILGIRHGENYQMLFLDTPGWYEGKLKLDHFYRSQVKETIKDADLFLFLIDGREPNLKRNLQLFEMLKKREDKPLLLILNKLDKLKQSQLIPLLNSMPEKYPGATEYIPLSALKSQNLEPLMDSMLSLMPEGPPFYPEEMFTDKSPAFLLSEFVREAFIQFLEEELPFSLAVVVEDIKDQEESILANISVYVERRGQKLILLGENGSLIGKVKRLAQKRARAFLECKVKLNLWIKIKPNWRQDARILSQIGYKV